MADTNFFGGTDKIGTGMAGGLESIFSKTTTATGDIKTQMDKVASATGDQQTVELTKLNYQIGQYNALIELTSSIAKSMVDTLKSVAQKA